VSHNAPDDAATDVFPYRREGDRPLALEFRRDLRKLAPRSVDVIDVVGDDEFESLDRLVVICRNSEV
jgi:hypothetical protein